MPSQDSPVHFSKAEPPRAELRTPEKKKNLVRKTGTKPAHKLEDYAGEYENPGYSILRVAAKSDHPEVTYNNITTPFEHWHYEVWNGATNPKDHTFEDVKIMFVMNMDGDVAALESALEPSVKAIVFTRRPDAKLRDPAYLARFLGAYDLSGANVTVAIKGDVLSVTVPGQPTYDLVPRQGDTFDLKGLTGCSVRFLSGAGGKVSEIQFNQPNGVFSGKRKP